MTGETAAELRARLGALAEALRTYADDEVESENFIAGLEADADAIDGMLARLSDAEKLSDFNPQDEEDCGACLYSEGPCPYHQGFNDGWSRAIDGMLARLAAAEADADRLAHELDQWGYGDMHYGSMPRDAGVVSALAHHTAALALRDQS